MKYALYERDFYYTGEWFDVNDDNPSVYKIFNSEQKALLEWQKLERKHLSETYYPLEKRSPFVGDSSDALSNKVFAQVIAFLKDTCKLDFEQSNQNFLRGYEVPVNDIPDDKLIDFLLLSNCNRFILKTFDEQNTQSYFVMHVPGYGYLPEDFAGYSDKIRATTNEEDFFGGEDFEADCVVNIEEGSYDIDFVTQFTHTDKENDTVCELLEEYPDAFEFDEDDGSIRFVEETEFEALFHMNKALEHPFFTLRKVSASELADINRGDDTT